MRRSDYDRLLHSDILTAVFLLKGFDKFCRFIDVVEGFCHDIKLRLGVFKQEGFVALLDELLDMSIGIDANLVDSDHDVELLRWRSATAVGIEARQWLDLGANTVAIDNGHFLPLR